MRTKFIVTNREVLLQTAELDKVSATAENEVQEWINNLSIRASVRVADFKFARNKCFVQATAHIGDYIIHRFLLTISSTVTVKEEVND